MDLCLDNEVICPKVGSNCTCLIRSRSWISSRSSNLELLKKLFSLIFVNVHSRLGSLRNLETRRGWSKGLKYNTQSAMREVLIESFWFHSILSRECRYSIQKIRKEL